MTTEEGEENHLEKNPIFRDNVIFIELFRIARGTLSKRR